MSFTILALVLVSAQEVFSGSLTALRLSDEYTRGASLARSEIDRLLANPALEAGDETITYDGDEAGGLPEPVRVDVLVAPLEEDGLEPIDERSAGAYGEALSVSVTVSWDRPPRSRDVTLVGLYLAKADASR